MFKKHLTAILAVSLISVLILGGCGKNNEEAPEAAQDVEEAMPAPTEAPEEITEKEPQAVEAASEDPEELPEYLSGDPEETSETDPADPNIAEGANTYEGEEISLTQNAVKAELGQTLTVSGDEGSYEITVDAIELTDARNEYANIEASKVVKVSYSYTGKGIDVLVDPFSFRLMNDKGEAYAAYPLDTNAFPEAEIMPSLEGGTVKCAIAFAVNDDSKKITLIFDDAFLLTGSEYFFEADI